LSEIKRRGAGGAMIRRLSAVVRHRLPADAARAPGRAAPGSAAELAVEFNGGIRSYYEVGMLSLYDDALAQQRFEEVNARFRRDIETAAGELRKKY
jgi:hypothetical protein